MNIFKKGFTLVELLLVLGIITVLMSLGGLSLANLRNDANIDFLASQVKIELIRAQRMTANGTQAGIYFESGRYVYFEGATYTEGAPTNIEVTLPTGHTFTSITFASNVAQFDAVTGYPLNYADPAQVVLTHGVTGKNHTVVVNRWGVVEIL